MTTLTNIYPFFTDAEGDPLDGGSIYIGADGLNPVTHPIALYVDADKTMAIQQPLRTVSGYVVHNGSPVNVYYDASTFSISVHSKIGWLVYSNLYASALGDSGASPSDGLFYTSTPALKAEEPPATDGATVFVNETKYAWDGSSVATDSAVAIKPDSVSGNGRWIADPDTVTLATFCVLGETDSSAGIAAANTYCTSNNMELVIPRGQWVNNADITFTCPVRFDGTMLTSKTKLVKLTKQPQKISDYLRAYVGNSYGDTYANEDGQTQALQAAVQTMMESIYWMVLDGEGLRVRLNKTIQCDSNWSAPTGGSYTDWKVIRDLSFVPNGAGATDGSIFNTGITEPLIRFFNSQHNRVELIHLLNCEFTANKKSAGVLWEGELYMPMMTGCYISNTNAYGIKQGSYEGYSDRGVGMLIDGCRILGGEYGADNTRTSVGIWLNRDDTKITNTTVAYWLKCLYMESCGSLLCVSSHFYNGSSDNLAPIIEITYGTSDSRFSSCYLDNGPIWLGTGMSDAAYAIGGIDFTNCIFTWGSTSGGMAERTCIELRPKNPNRFARDITVTGCVFRNLAHAGTVTPFAVKGTGSIAPNGAYGLNIRNNAFNDVTLMTSHPKKTIATATGNTTYAIDWTSVVVFGLNVLNIDSVAYYNAQAVALSASYQYVSAKTGNLILGVAHNGIATVAANVNGRDVDLHNGFSDN